MSKKTTPPETPPETPPATPSTPPETLPPARKKPVAMPKGRACPSCETPMRKGWKHCPACGVLISNDGHDADETDLAVRVQRLEAKTGVLDQIGPVLERFGIRLDGETVEAGDEGAANIIAETLRRTFGLRGK